MLELPGDRVFPEGIAVDQRDGTVYVGSTEDGTVYRATAGQPQAEVFLDPSEDGRTAVTGIAVDTERNLLLVAGRDTGRIFAYRVEDGSFVDSVELLGEGDSLVNDLAVVQDHVYVTDSFQPTLYRVRLAAEGLGRPEPWLDLQETPIPFTEGEFNLNGITAMNDATALLTVDYDTGRLFYVSLATSSQVPAVHEIDLGGQTLDGGDGIELDGTRLYVVSGDDIVVIQLAADQRSGDVVERISRDTWRYPTTIALRGDQILLVNSQLNMSGDEETPSLPFTVATLAKP